MDNYTQTLVQLDTMSTHQWSYDLARKRLDVEDLDKVPSFYQSWS